MKHVLFLVLCTLTLGLMGCASSPPVSYSDGVISGMSSMDAASIVKADKRNAIADSLIVNARPLLLIEGHENTPIVISGAKRIEVNAPIDTSKVLAAQPDPVPENVQMVRELRGVVGDTAGALLPFYSLKNLVPGATAAPTK